MCDRVHSPPSLICDQYTSFESDAPVIPDSLLALEYACPCDRHLEFKMPRRYCFSILDITLPTKVHLVKAMVFPVVMYGCESWTVKKAEHRRIDAFELWCSKEDS